MKKTYIVSAKRSAIGGFGGSLKDLKAAQIASPVIKASLEGVEKSLVDEVVLGQVLSAGGGMGPGRQASMGAGIPESVPGYTVNILCSSGMKAVMDAHAHILAGSANLVVAGGMESMSSAPFLLPGSTRWGKKLGAPRMEDAMLLDGLTDVFHQYHMGITAENIAQRMDISREDQDAFALMSQSRSKEAWESGAFQDEIVPLQLESRRGSLVFDRDEHPRSDVTKESLAKLRPAFLPEGTVTAGNASGINDGAAILLVASEAAVEQFELQPLVEIVGCSQAGIAPEIMGLGPVPAIGKLLEDCHVSLADIDLLELNEAFAAQSLGVIRELSQQHSVSDVQLLERCNQKGGAIALGHPLGASGARIMVTLVHSMKQQGATYGLASLCAGGGMGTAVLLKNL